MRTIKLFLIFALATSNVASAQNTSWYLWLESQSAIEKTEVHKVGFGERFATLTFGYSKSKVGFIVASSQGNLWGETILAPSISLGSVEFSAGVGIEHFAPYNRRVRLNLNYDDERSGSFLYIQSDFGQGAGWAWIDGAIFPTEFHKSFGTGVLLQMPGAGVGPKVEFRKGDHFGLWIAPIYEWNEKTTRVMFGMRLMAGN